MTNIKLSVIIPVHNAASFLSQCLDSVLSQSLQDLEVICIDDCSSDESPAILAKYAGKDSRITVLTNESNLRAGMSRNRGLEIAKGEYIHFLDADDYILPDSYKALYEKAVLHDVDVLKVKSHGMDMVTGVIKENPFFDLTRIDSELFDVVYTFEDHPDIFSNISVVPWNAFYKRSFLTRHQIRFNDLICVNDRSFFNNVVLHAKRFMLSTDYLVTYRMNNPDSLMGNRAKNFSCHFASYQIIYKQCLDCGLSAPLLFTVLDRELSDLFLWYRRFQSHDTYGASIMHGMYDFVQNLDVSFTQGFTVTNRWWTDYQFLLHLPILSVIVPVHNGEMHLRHCMDSLVSQNYPRLEIVAVDAHSTDSSMDILSEYALQYPHMVNILTSDSEYLGEARNLAIGQVHGEYVGFCRADAYYESYGLTKMCESMVKEDADLLYMPLYKCQAGKQYKYGELVPSVSQSTLLSHMPSLSFCNVLVKKELLVQTGAVPSLLHEELAYIPVLMAHAETIKTISDAYCYQYERLPLVNHPNASPEAVASDLFESLDFAIRHAGAYGNEVELCMVQKELEQMYSLPYDADIILEDLEKRKPSLKMNPIYQEYPEHFEIITRFLHLSDSAYAADASLLSLSKDAWSLLYQIPNEADSMQLRSLACEIENLRQKAERDKQNAKKKEQELKAEIAALQKSKTALEKKREELRNKQQILKEKLEKTKQEKERLKEDCRNAKQATKKLKASYNYRLTQKMSNSKLGLLLLRIYVKIARFQ